MSHGPYQKKYLVSPADMERLVEQYKGTLMENSRLTHAARLAAKQHVLLAFPEIPPATKKIRVKALGPEVRRATRRVRTMNLPAAGGAAGAGDDDDEFAQGPMETFLKTLIKSSTPQPKATPKRKPKVPPKPKIPSKTPISLPLPDDDWEQELAVPIPSTSKSKGTPTLGKGKSPLAGPSSSPAPAKKKTRFSYHLPKAVKEGKQLAKEVLKLKRQPGWSEWGEKVQRKLDGKDY